jgi:hypothetical protein
MKRFALLAILFPLVSLPCHATLGRAPTDFAGTGAKRARMLAAAGNAASGFSVNTSTLANGTTVREYVNPNGVVFAVSWNGPFLPDLRSLLGDQFGALTSESARHPKAGHSQVHVERPDLTIESTGHMRAYAGRAWINSLLPAGFNTNDIE